MKNKSLLSIISSIALLSAQSAQAVCPVCTVAVASGVGFSRWLGIDDAITGLWVGGLAVSMIMWTLSWFDKKNIRFRGRALATTAGYFILVVVPLYFMGIIGNSLNACACGLDKMLIGIATGSAAFWFAASGYSYLKEKNGGRAYFPFQKVAMPVSLLIILSVIFYFIIK